MRNTEPATKVSTMKRQLEGEKQRRQLLFFIEDHPGLSGYEIAQGLQWSRGKVAYHLKKLLNRGEIRNETRKINPKTQKVYFLVKWNDMINWEKIPKEKHL